MKLAFSKVHICPIHFPVCVLELAQETLFCGQTQQRDLVAVRCFLSLGGLLQRLFFCVDGTESNQDWKIRFIYCNCWKCGSVKGRNTTSVEYLNTGFLLCWCRALLAEPWSWTGCFVHTGWRWPLLWAFNGLIFSRHVGPWTSAVQHVCPDIPRFPVSSMFTDISRLATLQPSELSDQVWMTV